MALRLVRPDESGPGPLYPDWFLVVTPGMCYTVSLVMAREVERAISGWPRPRWVTFVDIVGARMRLRTSTIVAIEQCTTESRSLWRRFRADREAEEAEGTW